jgi:hypothetical protein
MNLPPRTDLDDVYPLPTVAQRRTALGDMRDFIALLFGTTTAALRTVWETFRLNGPGTLSNLGLDFSVAANAMTINVKTRALAVPTAADPVLCSMRNVTAATGDSNLRALTAATAFVLSSGSTFGHTSAVEGRLYLYLIDNVGTLELAVSSKFFGVMGLVSTTAEGGAGLADSATVMYSTVARANVPFRLIAMTRDTQTVAGTWTAVPTMVNVGQQTPFENDDSTGNTATATSAAACTGNAATATSAAACTGNAATATSAAACTGNAATATKLQTARLLNGASFDGTADVTVPTLTPGFGAVGSFTIAVQTAATLLLRGGTIFGSGMVAARQNGSTNDWDSDGGAALSGTWQLLSGALPAVANSVGFWQRIA